MEKNRWGQYGKSWDELEITDNFLFCKIMSQPEFCKEMIQRILGFSVNLISISQHEKQFTGSYESRGIRIDVAAEDDTRVFDIELQTVRKANLAKRIRYYQGTMDVDFLSHSQDYEDLKDSYIIFICDFDQFGMGEPVYPVKMILDIPSSVPYNDGTHKIFINLDACGKIKDPKLRTFMTYMKTKHPQDDFTGKIQKAVEFNRRNAEWRKEYMTIAMDLEYEKKLVRKEAREEGLAEGRELGMALGIAEGRAKGIAEGRTEGIAEGRAEGRAEGLAEGHEQGCAEGIQRGAETKSVEAAMVLVRKYGIDPEQAAEDLQLTEAAKDRLFAQLAE